MQDGHFCEHGADAYSYETCIRTQTDGGKAWIYNVTKYSKTTSRHQGKAFPEGIEAAGRRGEVHIIRLGNVPRGASANDLRALAADPEALAI
jgi:hypothetical protein